MKIELRERTDGHVRVYFEQTQDEQIERMLPRSVESLEQALANFEATLLPGAASFGRTIYADGRYVGDVWCYCIDCEQSPNAMLSYCIFDKALWERALPPKRLGCFCSRQWSAFRCARSGPSPLRTTKPRFGCWKRTALPCRNPLWRTAGSRSIWSAAVKGAAK